MAETAIEADMPASSPPSSVELQSVLTDIDAFDLSDDVREKLEQVCSLYMTKEDAETEVQELVEHVRSLESDDVRLEYIQKVLARAHDTQDQTGDSNSEDKSSTLVSESDEMDVEMQEASTPDGHHDSEMTEESSEDRDTVKTQQLVDHMGIPTFYSPGEGRRGRLRGLSSDAIERKTQDIESRFVDFPDGMKLEDFVAITKDLCGFPSFFNAPFFRRILHSTYPTDEKEEMENGEHIERIKKDQFYTYWLRELAPFDPFERFFRIIKHPERDFIERDDFAPFLHELLKYHPGLEFLSGTPEFQEKYALTVVVRIFYCVDRDSSGRLTLRKLRRSNLLEAFNYVDEEEDINKVNSYFSYEHFYVLYCKFWELDTDHDFLLGPDDLVRYGSHALTRAIVDRIFESGRRPFARLQTLSVEEKKSMSYEDFIYFMLSEEDKSNHASLRYWFELIDTDEDGVIRADEMRAFYQHQIDRMEALGHEVVPFADVLCQMSDLLHPKLEGEFRFQDFVRRDKIRLAGVFFNVLFNLSKFIEFEQRDPFLLRLQMAEPELTDWDRYARAEYARLAMEEDGQEEEGSAMEIDSMDTWYVSDDQVDAEVPLSADEEAGQDGLGQSEEADGDGNDASEMETTSSPSD